MCSTRLIQVYDHEVVFECRRMRCRESTEAVEIQNGRWGDVFNIRVYKHMIRMSTDDTNNGLSNSAADDLNLFCNCVLAYRERRLTYDGDIVNAFSGLLERFAAPRSVSSHQTSLPIQSVLGLPVSQSSPHASDLGDDGTPFIFLESLRWLGCADISRRRVEYPSWTWLGWKMPEGDRKIYFRRPLHMVSRALQASLFFQMKDGIQEPLSYFVDKSPPALNTFECLVLKAPMMEVRVCSTSIETEGFWRNSTFVYKAGDESYSYMWEAFRLYSLNEDHPEGIVLITALLYRGYRSNDVGMFRKSDDHDCVVFLRWKDQEQGTAERVGCEEFHNRGFGEWSTVKTRTIRLY